MPTFTHPITKKEITIPETISSNGDTLTFYANKEAGWGAGGWYKDSTGKEFIVKFDGFNRSLPYSEKLLNDLSRICIGTEFVAEETRVGHAEFEGKTTPCFITSKIENYLDIIDIGIISEIERKAKEAKRNASSEEEIKQIEQQTEKEIKQAEERIEQQSATKDGAEKLRKEVASLRKQNPTKFHRFYSFSALIGNDDLNEENIGIQNDETPFIIDYGIIPPFLHPEQRAHAATPFYLASLIGHRNLYSMPLVRRRHFGHDEFLNPSDRNKPQKEKLKDEDITYLSVLEGIQKIIEKRNEIAHLVSESFSNTMSDTSLTEDDKDSYSTRYSDFGEILNARINWMQESFAEDLRNIGDEKEHERLSAIKWRLHPKFLELMHYESDVFKQAAQAALNESTTTLSGLLNNRSREEILALDLREVEKSDLQAELKNKYALHNAIAADDFEMAKWLIKNDICDDNEVRRPLRNHNYQLHRTTPLHAAIAIYHDKLFYSDQASLKPLAEIIDLLAEKFIEKNGEEFDKKRDYRSEGVDTFGVEMTFWALDSYKQLASEQGLAATTIQRAFRVSQLAEQNLKEGNSK